MKWLPLILLCCASSCATTSRADRARLSTEGHALYDQKKYDECARSFVRAEKHYEAACCFALLNQPDPAFDALNRLTTDRDLPSVEEIEADADFASLKSDPRWAAFVKTLSTRIHQVAASQNAELRAIYEADQADRRTPDIDWAVVQPRDEQREKRVAEILEAQGATVADDYWHAAMVFQHGLTPDQIRRARSLALKAVELDPRHDSARWLAAAALDRELMYENKPQKYGTQFKREPEKGWYLWPVDPSTTDQERDEWNVPTLTTQQKRLALMNAPRP